MLLTTTVSSRWLVGMRKRPSALLRAPPRSPLMEMLALVIGDWAMESTIKPRRMTPWAELVQPAAMISVKKIQALVLVPNFIIDII
jgi:hypothetical protein